MRSSESRRCYKTSTIDHKPLKRTAFHALSAAIVTQERQLRTAVDYVLGILVHETVSQTSKGAQRPAISLGCCCLSTGK